MRILVIFLLLVSLAKAEININWCLEYMTTNHPNSSWVVQDDGRRVYISQWDSSLIKPTLEQVYAVWTNAAPWKSNQVIEIKCNTANWKDQQIDGETLADAFKALIICINKRLPATNKITAVEFKAELKGQLQN